MMDAAEARERADKLVRAILDVSMTGARVALAEAALLATWNEAVEAVLTAVPSADSQTRAVIRELRVPVP